MKFGFGKIKDALRSGTAKENGGAVNNNDRAAHNREEIKVQTVRVQTEGSGQTSEKRVVIAGRPHKVRKNRSYFLPSFRLGHLSNSSGKGRTPALYKGPDL